MIIQVTGTGTRNKGAELLLIAIQQQIQKRFPQAKICVSASFGSWAERARYQLRLVQPETPKGRWWLAGCMMPKAMREGVGFVREQEVDVILDASGFAFGDQLGAKRVKQFATDTFRWKRQGKPIILLPQAFGPFENATIRQAFKEVLNNVDLVYAREALSFEFIKELGGHSERRQAPDFTNLVKPPTQLPTQQTEYKSLIVPNYQMIAKTDKVRAAKYAPFLAKCFKHLVSLDLSPAFLLHDDRVDKKLVDPLRKELGATPPLISATDPLELKGLLGRAQLVIGSRFHALVSALSQGVPCIAVGWSHKYEMLLRDYGCEDSCLLVDASQSEIEETIARVHSDSTRWQHIADAGAQLTQRAEEMWGQLFDIIRKFDATDA